MSTPSVREYLASSDIHGLSYLANSSLSLVRRLLWWVAVGGAITALFTLTALRVAYYFSYPSTYNSEVDINYMPVPAMVVCPHQTHPVVLPSVRELLEMSDTHLIYLLHLVFRMESLLLPSSDGVWKLNGEWARFFLHLNLTDGQEAVSQLDAAPLHSSWFSYHLGDVGSVHQILQRIQQIDWEATTKIRLEETFLPFIRRYGISVGGGGGARFDCSLDNMYQSVSITKYNCTDRLHSVTTEFGECLLLDNQDGWLRFHGHGEGEGSPLYLSIQRLPEQDYYVGLDEEKFLLLLYDPNDLPSTAVQPERRWLGFASDVEVEIVRAFHSRVLDAPYSEERCSEGRQQSSCMKECALARAACVPYHWFSEEMWQAGGGKRMCQPWPASFSYPDEGQLARCKKACPKSCYTNFYAYQKVEGQHVAPGRYVTIMVRPREYTVYERYQQVEGYGPAELAAEVGGYMGLCVGASVLSLYQLVEWVGRWIQWLVGNSWPTTNMKHTK